MTKVSTPEFAAHQRGVLERAGEEQVVGGVDVDGDAHAGAVDIGGRFDRGVLRHHVDALDDDVGRGEVDLGGAHRLDGEEDDIDLAGLERLERLAGGVERKQLDADAEALRELAGEVGRDAGRRLRRALRQHRIAEIDGGAKLAGGGEILEDVGGNIGHGGGLYAENAPFPITACGPRTASKAHTGGGDAPHPDIPNGATKPGKTSRVGCKTGRRRG